MRETVKAWWPVVVWMGVIFSASADSASFNRSSRIIGPVVRWLFPHWTEDQVYLAVLVVRKMAHFLEYAVLACLVWWALWRSRQPQVRTWHWSLAGWVLAVVTAYALLDEFHQTFVPGRQGSLVDVGVDVLGGVAGLGLCRLWMWATSRRAGCPSDRVVVVAGADSRMPE